MLRVYEEASQAPTQPSNNKGPAIQRKPCAGGYDAQRQALMPVQAKGRLPSNGVQETAAAGVSGNGAQLPHLDAIQQSFGSHDVSGVQHFSGGAATDATAQLNAEAYTTQEKVASSGAMSKRTAAHEAAHVVQQRGGVDLKGGLGQEGDGYERNADAVADRVMAGQPAQDLLGQHAGSASPSVQAKAVQRKLSAPKMMCDKEGGTYDAKSCHLTVAQRSWARAEVGLRINAAFTNYMKACDKIGAKLKAALAADKAFLEIVLGVPFALATGGLGKLAMAGINKIPVGSPDWMYKAGMTILGKPSLITGPLGKLGGAVTKAAAGRHTDDAVGFVEKLESEGGAWAQIARGHVPGYTDDQLMAQYVAWDNKNTSLGHYIGVIKGHVKRFQSQVGTLDKDVMIRGGGYKDLKRLAYVTHKMGYKRLATVWHRYNPMTHNQQRGAVVQEQIKKLKAAQKVWRNNGMKGGAPTMEKFIKPPPIVKTDKLRFLEWVDPDMTKMAKAKWKATYTGRKEKDVVDLAPERLETKSSEVTKWVKETDAYAKKWGGAYSW